MDGTVFVQIPRDPHVLSAEVLHDGNTVQVRFSACADLSLIVLRRLLSGLSGIEVTAYRFTIVMGQVGEAVTDFIQEARFLDLVQFRFIMTKLPSRILHLGAIEIGVPGRVSDALCDAASLLLKGPGSFSAPVLQNIVDRLVEQAGNSPSLAASENLTDLSPVAASLLNRARVGAFKHLLELFERIIDELSLGLRPPWDAHLTLKYWLGQLFVTSHFEPFPSVGDSRSDH
ncbi:hypothetical protein [Streptomyces enissocaesilis]|uniref:hypothetical protein n=1 Tax=Streptomyces enissocaesilis TaxID=332589 RepID=UPI0031D01292